MLGRPNVYHALKEKMISGRRVVLCIGCNSYVHLSCLSGAERDAENVFRLLTDANYGAYTVDDARLLLSPRLPAVIEALNFLVRDKGPVDTLTLFFAGHGGVIKGTYYLATCESDPAMMSMSALALTHVFQMVNEISPTQCNIILDSCQSGGLINDIGTLLKPELIGKSSTSGISILATSASDQGSGETADGGIGTNALIRVLSGDVVLNSQVPFLDLVDIGRKVSELISDFAVQIPVVWGVNLYGQSRFTKNPHFDAALPSVLHDVTHIVPISRSGQIIAQAAETIWQTYYSNPDDLTPQRLHTTLALIIEPLSAQPSDACEFLRGISTTLRERLVKARNSFAVVEMLATCISLLSPSGGLDATTDCTLREFATQLIEEIQTQLECIRQNIEQDSTYLVSAGPPDLFYLPLRISRILGWAGAALQIADELSVERDGLESLVQDIVNIVLTTYPNSLTGMSDEETPYLMTFAHAAGSHGLQPAAEQVLGTMFNRLIRNGGKLAMTGLNPRNVLKYLQAQATSDFSNCSDMLANPLEALSMVLLFSVRYSFQDAVDPYLRQLDHVNHSIFVPDNHRDLSRLRIDNGRNHVFEIGNGIWRASDLAERWNHACRTQICADPSVSLTSVRIAALCSCLVFPDRSPWFLLRDCFYSTPLLDATLSAT